MVDSSIFHLLDDVQRATIEDINHPPPPPPPPQHTTGSWPVERSRHGTRDDAFEQFARDEVLLHGDEVDVYGDFDARLGFGRRLQRQRGREQQLRLGCDSDRQSLQHFEFSQNRPDDASKQFRGTSSSPAFRASQRRRSQRGAYTKASEAGGVESTSVARQENAVSSYTKSSSAFQPAYNPSTQQPMFLPHAPRLVHGIELLSTHELPDSFRAIFKFPNFNAIQSKCFPTVYKTNDNFVLSSPTGSGKTVIFELAILRLIKGFNQGEFKVVYQAPTKSLCSQRQRDWENKFRAFNLTCAELTGDTELSQLRNVQQAHIIITTPEKWDSMTRKWKDHATLMRMVKLFLIDEVHILREDRGPTLEAVVSRMKSIGSNVRFLALSATVPNSDDIAAWLGKDHVSQHIRAPEERFGEEFRPVLLQKHVVGYQSNSNDFAFEKTLDAKLPDIITRYSHKKPIMVFCATRSACIATAKLLANWWSTRPPKDRQWEAPLRFAAFTHKDLRECAPAAVAFHHAGLSSQDRLAVENGYLNGDLNVICCTSTLAVGVNLPCHFVIIKNTMAYGNEGLKEYSDLDIMQILGRAGRPQFDDSAVAVIMTKREKVKRYEQMVSGQEILESCLHKNLTEHLNAEIGLGTVTNLSTAMKWLSGTFLYVRLRANPEYYRLEHDSNEGTLEDRLKRICKNEIDILRDNLLIKGDSQLTSTGFGDAAARYSVQIDTAKILLSLPSKAKLSEILAALSQATEFKDLRFKAGEKAIFKELNNSQFIKFPIPVALDLPAHKVSLIIQSELGGVELPQNAKQTFNMMDHLVEVNMVFYHLRRLIRCIIDMQLCLEDSVALRNALMLCRSFGPRCWDDSPLQLKQIESIGLAGVRRLVNANIKSIEMLENTEAHRIDSIFVRNPPFGMNLIGFAKSFPKLRVSMQIIGQPIIKAGEGATVNVKAEIGFMNETPVLTYHRKVVYVVFLAETSDGRKVQFARMSGKSLSRGRDIKFSVLLTSSTQSVISHVMCDEFAGTLRSATLQPRIPSMAWPSQTTTQGTAIDVRAARPRMNSSRRLTPRPTAEKVSRTDSDEFGDGDLDDSDLLNAASGVSDLDFTHIDNIENYGDDTARRTNTNTATNAKQKSEDWQPKQLSNGKWACNHKCKDKNVCKHMCCRDGLDKAPKAPKQSNSCSAENSNQSLDSLKGQKKSQGGQATLALTAMRKSFDKSSTVSSSVALVDLTGESVNPKKSTQVPEGLRRLEELHSAAQGSHTVAIPDFAAHKQSPFPRTQHESCLLPDTEPKNIMATSDYGNSWPGEEMYDVSRVRLPRSENGRGEEIMRSSRRLDVFNLDADDETRFPADLNNDEQSEFGDGESILNEALVGLADSQDLQARRPNGAQNAEISMDSDLPLEAWSATPISRSPRGSVGVAELSSRSVAPLTQVSTRGIVRNRPFNDETSSPMFTTPAGAKRAAMAMEKDGLQKDIPLAKKTKRVEESDECASLIVNTPNLTASSVVTRTHICGADGASADVEGEGEGEGEEVDDWLLREFGDFVKFV